jgi:predicted dehydrogenase
MIWCFKDGKSINFDVSWAINAAESGQNVYLYGSKAGATVFPLTIYGEHNDYLTDNKPTFASEDPFYNEIAHFVECVKENKTPLATAAHGVKVQKILCGIYESARLGKAVDL